MDFAGQRVTVMGLGRFGGGVGVTRFLAERGARVLVTDTLPAEELRASVEQLSDAPGITYRLGEHRVSDFTEADLVVVNPAVKPDNSFVIATREAGVPLTSEVRLLVSHLPNRLRTIGITGSAGKSTTTAMIGHILRKYAKHEALRLCRIPSVWVGGNLGGSLLPRVNEIGPEDWVVLELSSFMLEGLREDRWSPHIAVITNVMPNHLDWHGSMDAYSKAKQAILDFQRDADGDRAFGGPGTHLAFQPRISDERTWMADSAEELMVSPPFELNLPGLHNQVNARLAHHAVEAALAMQPGHSFTMLDDFCGLPHRLEYVGEVAADAMRAEARTPGSPIPRDPVPGGVRCYNDSKSTTPEAAVLAIKAFDPGTVRIILGGYDKGSDFAALAAVAAERCTGVYTIGTTGDGIADKVKKNMRVEPRTPGVARCGTLDVAVRRALTDAGPDEVMVLSPGCASWDQFANYEERGNRFVELVRSGRNPPA